VAWHPTRSFLAVTASDGLVDRWGPRINWTAFAPDFQALPQNVEYVEQEDEFDIVDNGVEKEGKKDGDKEDEERDDVDILTLHKIPVFQSDSEDESEVFHFEVFKRPTGSNSS
jgi:COMPASS component SWD1